MYESKRLTELRNMIPNIKDDKTQQWAIDVAESAEWYFNCDWLEDLDNFNGFFEGCQPALDNLIGEEDVDRAYNCAELFIEHFGNKCAIENDNIMQLIYVRVVDCLLTMVMDYGI